MPQPVPESVSVFASQVLAADEATYTFDDAEFDVPARFDGPAKQATWRLEGTVRIRITEFE